MKKLNYEQSIEIYTKVKAKVSVTYLSNIYGVSRKTIYYLVRLIDKHGKEILKKDKIKYSQEFKEKAIKRVLENHEPTKVVAIDIGLSSDGELNRWVKVYKENGYNMVKRKRGPNLVMNRKTKKQNKNETQEEKIKRLEEENLYLKAELEYTKKLGAVVQARKNRQQKKK